MSRTGLHAAGPRDLKTLARPLLDEVVPDLADAASLGMLDGPDIVYIERAQADTSRLNIDRRRAAGQGPMPRHLDTPSSRACRSARQRDILERSKL